jgi:hypothetical protein
MNWFGSKEGDYNLYGELIIRVLFLKSKNFNDKEKKKPVIPPVIIITLATTQKVGELRERISSLFHIEYEYQIIYSFNILDDDDLIPVKSFEKIKDKSSSSSEENEREKQSDNDADDFYRPRLIVVIDLNSPIHIDYDYLHLPKSPQNKGDFTTNMARNMRAARLSRQSTSVSSSTFRSGSRKHRGSDDDDYDDEEDDEDDENEDGDERALGQGEKKFHYFSVVPHQDYGLPPEILHNSSNPAASSAFDLVCELKKIDCELYGESLMKAGFYQEVRLLVDCSLPFTLFLPFFRYVGIIC